jgi:hypothetical protein
MAAQYGDSIWLATGLSYLDRAAAFICPLLVLKWLDRSDVYVSIEFIISLSIIFATFFDAGLRSYMLFDARERGSSAAISSIAQALKPLIWLHIIGVLVALVLGGGSSQLVGLAVARGSALSVSGLVIQWLILTGRPAFGPLVSIANWGVSCLVFALPTEASNIVLSSVFFSGSFAVMFATLSFTVLPLGKIDRIGSAMQHLANSLRWGWPLLISAAASMVVGNYSKVYAFLNLSYEEVLAFTFWMRAFSVVQLSHVAIISILIAQIYTTGRNGILYDNLIRYIIFVAPPALLVLFLGIFGDVWISSLPFMTTPATVILFSYFSLWCLGAYFEVYLSSNGKNSAILKSSLWASAIYVIGIVFGKPSSAMHLALLMAVSSAFYTVLIVWKIRQN